MISTILVRFETVRTNSASEFPDARRFRHGCGRNRQNLPGIDLAFSVYNAALFFEAVSESGTMNNAAPKPKAEKHPAANDAVSAAPLGANLGRLLHDVARLRRRAFNILSAPAGLTRTQYWLLAFIDKSAEAALTQSQVAASLNIGKVAVGATIDRLVERDLVRRGVDSKDRRLKPLSVTAKGRKALESMQTVRPIIDELVFRGMPEAARLALIENLECVRNNLVYMLDRQRPAAGIEPKMRKSAARRSEGEEQPRTRSFISFG
jgi:DNA-binding MarR family transcriptional regulator